MARTIEEHGMFVIVLDTATEDEALTETTLRRSGYARREVWVKRIDKDGAPYEEAVIRNLGVGRYVVADACGRGPE